jgi:copper chaperone CopZ
MKKTIFKIEQMDCPSEENLIRMKLQNIEGIAKQEFDLKRQGFNRLPHGDYKVIEHQLATLNLGSRFIESLAAGDFHAEE